MMHDIQINTFSFLFLIAAKGVVGQSDINIYINGPTNIIHCEASTDIDECSTNKCTNDQVEVLQTTQMPQQGRVYMDLSWWQGPNRRVVIELDHQLPKLFDYLLEVFSQGDEPSGGPLVKKFAMEKYRTTMRVYTYHGFPRQLPSRWRLTPDSNATSLASRGDVVAHLTDSGGVGFLHALYFNIGEMEYNTAVVVGKLVEGMDVLDQFHDEAESSTRIDITGYGLEV